ncbi:hypothetical protein [Flocculibacter collagenilyticus]|uniref:hypothetical protein n=1 Tax=Flocculibacter collagenilyticus TaxID=2744479 RepID=UPI0018F6B38A|nr:hypothetical protein [Flocculibacter collagenilyticus]
MKIKHLNSGFIIALLGVLGSLALAIFQYSATQDQKLKDFEKQRKEEAYKSLIYSLNGFYGELSNCLSESEIHKLRFDFSNQMDNCWLYCSDEIVYKTQELINAIANNAPEIEQSRIRDEVFVAMRREFKPKTKLKANEYVRLNPVKPDMKKCNLRLVNGKVESKT